jgi:alkanesulfonate monooxygenase SsuD/methylene tetrahydromethanopterin reductase-like flavin-dependent oxidoreductase (luciferase family)
MVGQRNEKAAADNVFHLTHIHTVYKKHCSCFVLLPTAAAGLTSRINVVAGFWLGMNWSPKVSAPPSFATGQLSSAT